MPSVAAQSPVGMTLAGSSISTTVCSGACARCMCWRSCAASAFTTPKRRADLAGCGNTSFASEILPRSLSGIGARAARHDCSSAHARAEPSRRTASSPSRRCAHRKPRASPTSTRFSARRNITAFSPTFFGTDATVPRTGGSGERLQRVEVCRKPTGWVVDHGLSDVGIAVELVAVKIEGVDVPVPEQVRSQELSGDVVSS